MAEGPWAAQLARSLAEQWVWPFLQMARKLMTAVALSQLAVEGVLGRHQLLGVTESLV